MDATEFSRRVSRVSRRALPAAASLLATLPARAAPLTWDSNGAAAGTGGNGAWNTSTLLWFDGTAFRSWSNAALDDAVFGGTVGAVTVGVPITVHNLSFNTTGYTLTNGTLTLAGVSPTITVNTGVGASINSLIAGTAGLTKNGAGTFAVSGNNTGLSGVVTVNAGTLNVSNANALGSSTAASDLVLNSGTTLGVNEDFAHDFTLTGGTVVITGTGTTFSGAPTLTAPTTLSLQAAAGGITLAGNLSDNGAVLSLVRNGGGIVALSGTNTYSGSTVVNAGTFRFDSPGALSPNTNLVLNGASALVVLASSSFSRSVGSGAGQVQWTGSGGFAGINAARTVNLGPSVTWGSGGFIPSGSTLILASQRSGPLDFQTGIDLNGGQRTVQVTSNSSVERPIISGVLSGTGGLTVTGGGRLGLVAANTYTGPTLLQAGILEIDLLANGGAPSSLGASGAGSANLVLSGGTTLHYLGAGGSTDRAFTLAGNATFDASGSGPLAWGGAAVSDSTTAPRTLTLTGDNTGANEFGGLLADVNAATGGTLAVTKTGAGRWVLTGNDTYTGGTIVSAGTLQIGNGGTTGNIAGDVLDDAVLAFNRADTVVYGGTVSGAGAFVQQGSGTLTLLGNVGTAGGVIVSGGTLQVGGGGVTGGVGNVVNDGVLAWNRSDDFVYAGAVSGTGNVVKLGPGTLAIAGDVASSGSVTVSAGTLQVGNGGAAGTIAGDIVDNGVLAFDRSDSYQQSSTISGSGALEQRGAGTLTLARANTYTGPTTVSRGTLQGGAANVVASSSGLAVAAGATFTLGGFDQAIARLEGAGSVDLGANALALTGPGAGVVATFSGVVAGSGALTKNGAYTQILTGDNTYGGVTTIGAGTLQLGDGGTTGTLGAGDIVNDATLAIDRADAVTIANTISGSGVLEQLGAGTTTLSAASTLGAVNVLGGTLAVDGTLTTTAVAIANGATLKVDGTLAAAAVAPVQIAGSSSNDSLIVGTAGTARAAGSLGDGADLLDVAGTLDTGGGSLDLGAGDDTFTIHDGTRVLGTVLGGAGANIFNTAIETAAELGAVTGFPTLRKTGAGVLNVNGPAGSAFDTVLVQAGNLHVAAGAVVDPQTTNVAAGATLTVDGVYRGTAGADAMTVGGTAAGGGTIDLGDADDVLTLTDGARIDIAIDGGAQAAGDRVVLDVATALDYDAGRTVGFEALSKRGSGSATLTGSQIFTGGAEVDAGRLDVAGTLITPTLLLANGAILNVTGAMVATGFGDTMQLTGGARTSASTSTLSVAAGGRMLAEGDLGDGNDLVEVSGTLSTGTGSLSLGSGDDRLIVHDGTRILGLVDGGSGVNTLAADIAGVAELGGATAFSTLAKTGAGTLNVAGPAGSMFDTVLVHGGTLAVAPGAVVDPRTTDVAADATLAVEGVYRGTAAADTLAVAGALTGAGTIDLGDGDDLLRLVTGSDVALAGVLDAAAGADRLVLDGEGSASFDVARIGPIFASFETFEKTGGGTWRLGGAGAQSWTVTAGTLIGDAASLAGDLADDATVVFDQAGDGVYAGTLSGGGALVKSNAGTLTIAAASLFAGTVAVDTGTLELDGTLASAMIAVKTGGVLSGVGTAGNVTTAAGAVVAPGTPGSPFGTLTIAGNYAGAGTVRLNTVLGDETSATSRLVIRGDSAAASSSVLVVRAGGDGQQTSGDGIKLVEVGGASPAGSFRLAAPVQAGAYEYALFQGGVADANDWFLRSEFTGPPPGPPPEPRPAPVPLPLFRPAVAAYVLGQRVDVEYGFAAAGDFRSRAGDRFRGDANANVGDRGWMRLGARDFALHGQRFEIDDARLTTLQLGADFLDSDSRHAGVMLSVGEAAATFDDPVRAFVGLATRAGKVETSAGGVGAYFTTLDARGAYFDASGMFTHYENRYRDQFSEKSTQTGYGATLSAEMGGAIPLGASAWTIEPQIQVAYQRLELDAFTDTVSPVGTVTDDTLRARAGLQLFRTAADAAATPYAVVDLYRDLRGGSPITVAAIEIRERPPDSSWDVGGGFYWANRDKLRLHFDVRYRRDSNDAEGFVMNLGGSLGF